MLSAAVVIGALRFKWQLSAAAKKIYQNSDWVQHLHVKNKLYPSAGKFSRRQIHDTFVIPPTPPHPPPPPPPKEKKMNLH